MLYAQIILASLLILSGILQLFALWRPSLARPWPVPPKLSTMTQTSERRLFVTVWSAQALTVILLGVVLGFGQILPTIFTFAIGVVAAICALIALMNRSLLTKI